MPHEDHMLLLWMTVGSKILIGTRPTAMTSTSHLVCANLNGHARHGRLRALFFFFLLLLLFVLLATACRSEAEPAAAPNCDERGQYYDQRNDPDSQTIVITTILGTFNVWVWSEIGRIVDRPIIGRVRSEDSLQLGGLKHIYEGLLNDTGFALTGYRHLQVESGNRDRNIRVGIIEPNDSIIFFGACCSRNHLHQAQSCAAVHFRSFQAIMKHELSV